LTVLNHLPTVPARLSSSRPPSGDPPKNPSYIQPFTRCAGFPRAFWGGHWSLCRQRMATIPVNPEDDPPEPGFKRTGMNRRSERGMRPRSDSGSRPQPFLYTRPGPIRIAGPTCLPIQPTHPAHPSNGSAFPKLYTHPWIHSSAVHRH
jgi:hypothetical protein